MQHAWNTHCHYTRHGQRIAAELREDGSVVFVDIDRGIYGIIVEPSPFPVHKNYHLQEHVMLCYLYNNFRPAWDEPEIDALVELAKKC